MALTINAPDVESRLQEEAARQGLTTEEYVRQLLERHLPQEGSRAEEQTLKESPQPSGQEQPFYQRATKEEWEQAFVAWVESHNDFPKLPPEAFERASFYEGRP